MSKKANDEFRDLLRVEGVNAKGFGIIPKLVMQDPRLTRDAKAIYAYICSFAGAGTTAFPSTEKMCRDLGFGKHETMKKHRDLLEKYGYIKVEQQRENGKFARNVYILVEKPVEKGEEDKNIPTENFKNSQNPKTLDNKGISPIPNYRGSLQKGTPKTGNPFNGGCKNNNSTKNNSSTKNNNNNTLKAHSTVQGTRNVAKDSQPEDVVVFLNKLFKNAVGYQNKDFIESKLNQYDPDYIKEKLLLLEKNKNKVKKPEAWLTKALEEDYKDTAFERNNKTDLDRLKEHFKESITNLIELIGLEKVKNISDIKFSSEGLLVWLTDSLLAKYEKEFKQVFNVNNVQFIY